MPRIQGAVQGPIIRRGDMHPHFNRSCCVLRSINALGYVSLGLLRKSKGALRKRQGM